MATGDDDLAIDQRRGTLQLVAGEEDRDPGPRRVPDEGVEEVAPDRVEPGVGFVEQPDAGVAHQEGGERGAAPLTGREPTHGEVAGAGVDAGAVHRDRGFGGAASSLGPEAHVLGDGEVVVEPGGVAEQGDVPAHGLPVAPQVDAEHRGLAPDDRHQAGDGPQQRGLAGTVGSPEEHDLSGLDVEVDTGKGGETAQQADRGAKVDDGVHEDRGKRYLRPRRSTKTRVIGAIGRVLIAFGLLVLLFVAYQLWGTSLHEARAQRALRHQFDPIERTVTAPTVPGATTSTTAPSDPVPGSAVALLRIPKIGVDKAVVEGVGVPDLKRGPGHYPGTPLPGQPGNAAIAGHRTTYGAPFWHLDELKPGDQIFVTTREGRFTYRVDRSEVVKPSETSVLDPTVGAVLTLTTCNPRFSASQRLVVQASLMGTPAPAPPTTLPPATASGSSPSVTVPARPAIEGLSGEGSATWPTVWWGALAALVALASWLLARRFHWLVYLPATPIFLVVLFVFYENVARLLPANI